MYWWYPQLEAQRAWLYCTTGTTLLPPPMALKKSEQANCQSGFSLLEAVVALVLIAGSGMALFAWINTNLITLARAQRVIEQQQDLRNAVAYMRQVNPMLSSQGAVNVGELRIEWGVQPVTQPKDSVDYPIGVGLHKVTLYLTTVRLFREEEKTAEYQFYQAGYQKTRGLNGFE